MKHKMPGFINIAAAALCMLVLLAGLVRTIISPDNEILYENRPATKLSTPSLASFAEGSFQDSAEDALSDQVNLAIKMKKLYNIMDTGLALPMIEALQDARGGYIGIRNVNFFEDALVVKPSSLEDKKDALDRSIKRLNDYQARLDADMYVYYVEADMDLNFESGEKSGIYEYLESSLTLPEENIDRLELGSFEEYRLNFLRTDHHWNGNGAYQAYLEICSMLGCPALESMGQHSIDGIYRGTRAAGLEGVSTEAFTVNIFDFPAIDVYIDGEGVSDYGMQHQFINGELDSFSYGSVFGPDCAELIFDTGKSGKNLLVMGDSYDNAIVKVLASGFARTHCVDLRNYEAGSFDLVSYAKENNIDAVIFIGTLSYFGSTLAQ